MTGMGFGDGRSDALARARDFSEPARIPAQDDGDGGSASASARRLWEALCQARNEQQPLTQARLEDAVFDFYLPRARALAYQIAADDTDREARGGAAELGLARSVLGWQPSDPEGFERYLRASIASELRNTGRRRRPTHESAISPQGGTSESGELAPQQ